MIGLQPLDIAVLAGYFVVVAAVGVAAARLVRTREDYFMGGRRFGKLFTIFFSFGAGTHADNAVIVAGQSYRYGTLAGIWYQWVMVFTLPIYWLLAPVFRRARVLTTAEFFEHRFGAGFMYLYAAFALFFCLTSTSVMLFVSAKLIEAVTGGEIPWQWGILLLAVISYLYGILGGLVAAVWNDLFQGILTIVMSLLLLPFFWSRVGGADGFRSALLGNDLSPHAAFRLVMPENITLFWIVMASVASLLSMVPQPHILANAGATKTEMDSRVGFVGGMLLKRLLTVAWALTGVMAIALLGQAAVKPDHAFGAMARELLPVGFGGLMLAAIMASVMDNCAVMMIMFAGIYTENVHKRLLGREMGERGAVVVGRWAAVWFAVVSIGLSYAFTEGGEAMRFMWKTFPLMGIPFFLAVLWRRATAAGEFAGFFAALVAMLTGQYGLGWTGDEGFPKVILLYLIVGFAAGILVSLLAPPTPRRRREYFYLLLKTPLGQEDLLRRAGLVERPGTGTFDYPPDADTDEPVSPELVPDRTKARAEAVGGFVVLSVVVVAMVAGLVVMAAWLAGEPLGVYLGL